MDDDPSIRSVPPRRGGPASSFAAPSRHRSAETRRSRSLGCSWSGRVCPVSKGSLIEAAWARTLPWKTATWRSQIAALRRVLDEAGAGSASWIETLAKERGLSLCRTGGHDGRAPWNRRERAGHPPRLALPDKAVDRGAAVFKSQRRPRAGLLSRTGFVDGHHHWAFQRINWLFVIGAQTSSFIYKDRAGST